MDNINSDPLSSLRLVILRCLFEKIIKNIPCSIDLEYTYGGQYGDEGFLDHCHFLLERDYVWKSLPNMISVEEGDFADVFAEIESIDGIVTGVSLQHTFFTKEALREELAQYLKRFDTSVVILTRLPGVESAEETVAEASFWSK